MLFGILGAGVIAGGALLWFLFSSDPEPSPTETFEVRWSAYSYDPDALATQLGGGRPELADRFVEVLAWDPNGVYDRDEVRWVGERVAARGAGYDGLNDAEYLVMDDFMMAVPHPEGLGAEIDAQPCGMLSSRLLQELSRDLSAPSSALEALREGRRIGGGDPALDEHGYRHAYAILTPAETLALVTELEGPWAALGDRSPDDAEVLACLRAAADAERGTYYANED